MLAAGPLGRGRVPASAPLGGACWMAWWWANGWSITVQRTSEKRAAQPRGARHVCTRDLGCDSRAGVARSEGRAAPDCSAPLRGWVGRSIER